MSERWKIEYPSLISINKGIFMAHDVFISYSSKNQQIADEICAKLELKKIRCWMAPRNILPGEDHPEAIINGIECSKIFILVLSSHANMSRHVVSEVREAFNNGIMIIPFRIDNVTPKRSLQYYIGAPQWFDATSRSIEEHIKELEQIISIFLERENQIKSKQITRVISKSEKTKSLTRYGEIWEIFALTVIFWIIEQSSGICVKISPGKFKELEEKIRKKEGFINHDLRKSLSTAYLLALMNISNGCLKAIMGSKEKLKTEIKWLEGKQRELSNDLTLNERGIPNSAIETLFEELETILLPNPVPDSKYIPSIRDAFIDFTLNDESVPDCFKQKVKNSLFDGLSLYFVFELNNNDKIKSLFENQVFIQTDFRIESLDRSIREISRKYPELQTKLDLVQEEIISAGIPFNAFRKEILKVLTGSVFDTSETTEHLKKLTYCFDEAGKIFFDSSDFNALLYIKKDEVILKNYIPLKNDQKIFTLGRNVPNSSPDIPFDSAFISKKHAIIENRNNEFVIKDLMSKNGTRINGIPLERDKDYLLDHGDQISLAYDDGICYFFRRKDPGETLELRDKR
jgi:hypothetical protein